MLDFWFIFTGLLAVRKAQGIISLLGVICKLDVGMLEEVLPLHTLIHVVLKTLLKKVKTF